MLLCEVASLRSTSATLRSSVATKHELIFWGIFFNKFNFALILSVSWCLKTGENWTVLKYPPLFDENNGHTLKF
jgi:hypothetical protein